ncbi:MAG: hypothetical protein WAT58_05265 [Candidatus Dormiibacterota bacterium]
MPYGNEPPPAGAPVPPQELIGAALFLGLAAVLSISFHGAYLIAFALGRVGFDPLTLGVLTLNAVGFVGTLWLLALRRWAWGLAVGYAGLEVILRLYYVFNDLVARPNGNPDWLGGIGEVALALVFLVVLAYLLGEDTRERLDAREAYRRAQA